MGASVDRRTRRRGDGWNRIRRGDARRLLADVDDESVDLALFSPPYHVGRGYERGQSVGEWRKLLAEVLEALGRTLRRGGFAVVNIGEARTFPDPSIQPHRAVLVSRRKGVSSGDVARVSAEHPEWGPARIARELGCSDQTVRRRQRGSHARGAAPQANATRILPSDDIVVRPAADAGLYLHDHRVWVKDPAWKNNPWHATSYRAVDEWEHMYLFCRPGSMRFDRSRLTPREWADWGSRSVWTVPSVGRQEPGEARFPLEIPMRWIRLLTDPGDHVVDPFAGSGTTAVAAALLDRRWLGFDASPVAVRRARRRVRTEGAGEPELFT